ncbi:MAG: bifunctional DNA primase/polymerase, partial [Candidatus Izemoplasmatales bacterium]|nr:bifunctional DNA primase/polymerase [Candidatus Izemoplasmatales bacterium]
MNNLLPLALTYLQRGYSVIPVGPEKRPLISWKEFQSRLATTEELVKWWTENPDAQIGIITGKVSNLTVIDVEAEGDFGIVTDQTYIIETGGKGRHYYFKYEPEFRNAVRIFPLVDVRSEGGYVVAAGSTTSKGAYTAVNTLEVAKMTPETKTRFLSATKRRLEPSTQEVVSYPHTNTSGLDYAGFGAGMRNDEMTRYAGAIHAKIHPSLWPTIGLKMFEEANLKNTPPLSTGELRVIWNSIGQAEQRQNPGGRTFTPSAPKTWGPAEETVSPEAVQEGEADPKDTLHASEVARLQIIDSASTYPVDMKPFDDALLGGFSLGEVIVVAGQSGTGKTTIIQDWTTTLATGGKTARDKLPVLWFSYEVLARPLWEKFEKMGATPD